MLKAEYDSLLAVAAAASSAMGIVADGIDRGSGFRRHTEPSTSIICQYLSKERERERRRRPNVAGVVGAKNFRGKHNNVQSRSS